MSLEIFPKVNRCQLSDVQPGTLIQYKKALALRLAPPEDQPELYRIAHLPAEGPFTFETLHPHSEVLSYGDQLVLKLELDEEKAVLREPGDETCRHLFFFRDGPRVLVGVGGFGYSAFVKLHNGEMVSLSYETLPAFTRWRLGVQSAFGDPVWMLNCTSAQ